MKIIAIFSTTVGLHSLALDHPVLHLIDYPDGTTNAPVPQAALAANYGPVEGPVEQLISLSVSHIEVQQGELRGKTGKCLEFAARDLALLLNYSLLRRQYEAHLRRRETWTRAYRIAPRRVASRCRAGSGPWTSRYQTV